MTRGCNPVSQPSCRQTTVHPIQRVDQPGRNPPLPQPRRWLLWLGRNTGAGATPVSFAVYRSVHPCG